MQLLPEPCSSVLSFEDGSAREIKASERQDRSPSSDPLPWIFRMEQRISPARRLSGEVLLPGDKSVSHRYAMLSAIAEGPSKLHNYSSGADCHSTLECVRSLGVTWTKSGNTVEVEGRGLDRLQAPSETLDAGNSGSTIRMLSGILAAQPFTTRIAGDESLSRRPMERIMTPLREMGATIRGARRPFSAAGDSGRHAARDRLHSSGRERPGKELCSVCRPLLRRHDDGSRVDPDARSHASWRSGSSALKSPSARASSASKASRR